MREIVEPYVWLPVGHWREDWPGRRCQHGRPGCLDLCCRPATGRATVVGGEVRYWRVCPGCGLEVGPFVMPSAARAWRWPPYRKA